MSAPVISGRAASIAAIHALAIWLSEHPEAPAPTYITATYSVGPRDEVDEATRVAGIESVAAAVGIDLIENGAGTVQGDLELHYERDLTMIYRIAAHKDAHSTARYLESRKGN